MRKTYRARPMEPDLPDVQDEQDLRIKPNPICGWNPSGQQKCYDIAIAVKVVGTQRVGGQLRPTYRYTCQRHVNEPNLTFWHTIDKPGDHWWQTGGWLDA